MAHDAQLGLAAEHPVEAGKQQAVSDVARHARAAQAGA
jgi:hypothetical protein